MTRVLICALAVSVIATTAAAATQEPPPVQPPPPQQTAPPSTAPPSTPPDTPAQAVPPAAQVPTPVAAPPPVVPQPLDEATARLRRREIQNIEGLLSSAVKGAAQEIARELETPETGPFLLSGKHTARGFILDGYGVFFHVEIPGVEPALISPAVLQALEERLARGRQAQPEVASAGTASPSAPANRNAVYVERVKNALMRAMIQYSKPLALRPDEWLTIAASDGDEPLMPTVLSEQAIMVLRIRGRDINDYLAERLSLEEVLKKVEVRKF